MQNVLRHVKFNRHAHQDGQIQPHPWGQVLELQHVKMPPIHQHRAHSGWVEVEKGDVQSRDEIVKLNQVRHTKMVWLGGWWLGGWLVGGG